MECEERIDPRPFVNGVALVVIETIIFAGVYLYLYIKEKQDSWNIPILLCIPIPEISWINSVVDHIGSSPWYS